MVHTYNTHGDGKTSALSKKGVFDKLQCIKTGTK